MDPVTISAIISAAAQLASMAYDKWGKGKNDEYGRTSTVSPGVQRNIDLINKQLGQGGGIESALQYYIDLLNNNPEAFAKFEAPAMRQFNEQIIPGIAERFSSIDAQKSSAFPQALSQAAADLSERLSAQRANLQAGAAQGIQSFTNTGMQPTFALQQPQQSWLQAAGPGFAETLGKIAGGIWGKESNDRGTNPAAKSASGLPMNGPGASNRFQYNPYAIGMTGSNMPYAAQGITYQPGF